MTKVRNAALAVFGVAVLSLPSIGMAQSMSGPDSGWYIGGSVGQSKAKDVCSGVSGPGVSCEDTDTAYRIFGGYQINKHFAVELGYYQLGEATASGTFRATIESKAWDLVAVGILPIGDKFSVYGKLGMYMADTDFSTNNPAFSNESKSNTDLTYGIGVGYDFTKNFGIRAEYQVFKDVGGGDIGTADVDVMSIGIVYRFK